MGGKANAPPPPLYDRDSVLVGIGEIAAALRTGAKTVRGLIKGGKLPVAIIDGTYRIRYGTLMAWLDAQTICQRIEPQTQS